MSWQAVYSTQEILKIAIILSLFFNVSQIQWPDFINICHINFDFEIFIDLSDTL